MRTWATLLVLGVGGPGLAVQPPANKPPEPQVEKPRLVDPADWSVPTRDAAGKLVEVFWSTVWTPDGKAVLATVTPLDPDRRGRVQAFDAATGKPGVVYRGVNTHYGQNHRAVAVSGDGKRVAACGSVFAKRADGTRVADSTHAVEVWDADGKLRRKLDLPDSGTGVRFTADGNTVVATYRAGGVMGWDAATGAERFHHRTAPLRAWSLAVHPAGLLAVGGAEPNAPGRVRLIDPATGRTVAEAATGGGSVSALEFDPAGDRLASGGSGNDGIDEQTRIVGRVWAVKDGTLVAPQDVIGESHWFGGRAVGGLAFTPDDRLGRLGVLAEDGVLRFYRPADGRLRYVFPGHQGRGRSVAFSPDGRKAVTAGSDRLAVWDLQAVEAWRPPQYYR